MMRAMPRYSIRYAQMIVAFYFALTGISSYAAGGEASMSWNFDAVSPGTLPDAFKIGRLYDGRPAGDWQVLETSDAVSAPHVLAQLSDKGAEHAYKMFLIDGTEVSNLELSVSFRADWWQRRHGRGSDLASRGRSQLLSHPRKST